LKSTETEYVMIWETANDDFSNFGSLKSTETRRHPVRQTQLVPFSNFGSLKSTETVYECEDGTIYVQISAISAR